MDRRSVHEPFATRSSHRDQYIAVLVLLKAALNGRMGLGWLHSGLFRNLGTRKLTNGSGLTNPVHLNRGGTLGWNERGGPSKLTVSPQRRPRDLDELCDELEGILRHRVAELQKWTKTVQKYCQKYVQNRGQKGSKILLADEKVP